MAVAISTALLAAGCGDDGRAGPQEPAEVRNDALATSAAPTPAEVREWPSRWCELEVGDTRAALVATMGEPTGEFTLEQTSNPQLSWDAFEHSFTAFFDSRGRVRILQVNGSDDDVSCPRVRR